MPSVADATAAWDQLPDRLDEVAATTQVAAAPVVRLEVDEADEVLRRELARRLGALGFGRSGAGSRSVRAVRRSWTRFQEARGVRADGVLDPPGWEALLALTVLERPLRASNHTDDLHFRARRTRMDVLGLPAFRDGVRFPGLHVALFDLGVPSAVAAGREATAETDRSVGVLLDDLESLTDLVLAHLESLPPDQQDAVEADNSAFLERIGFVDAVATGWVEPETPVAIEQPEVTLFDEEVVTDAADLWRDDRRPAAGPLPLGREALEGLGYALAPPGEAPELEDTSDIYESLEGALGLERPESAARKPGPPSHIRVSYLRRMVSERQLPVLDEVPEATGLRAPRVDVDRLMEEHLDVERRPELAGLLREAAGWFGDRIPAIWEGVRRFGAWIRRQWESVRRFFEGLFGSGSPDARRKDRKFWRVALQWIGSRIQGVLEGAVSAGRAVAAWISGAGRTLEHDGEVVGGFVLAADFDVAVASVPGVEMQRVVDALQEQRRGFSIATEILSTVVDVLIAFLTGGATVAWRLVTMLARAWQAWLRKRRRRRLSVVPIPA